jgi:hypothetical protein
MVIAPLIFAITASASVAMDDGSGTEPTLRKAHLPPITTVTIRNSGATSAASGEPEEQCADFRLGYQEIRDYIANAAEVAEHDYFHMLDWSPCYASGEVTFKNGVTGIWTIQQYRAGWLKLSNGRTLYMYCPQCQAKAFPAADE